MNEETPKISPDDLVQREGLYYKKFTNIPFTGSAEEYSPNGQLFEIRPYKDGKLDGLWKMYYTNGQLFEIRP